MNQINTRLIQIIYESDEKGDFEVVYGRTCMARSGRSVRDRWCVWICENSALARADKTSYLVNVSENNGGHSGY